MAADRETDQIREGTQKPMKIEKHTDNRHKNELKVTFKELKKSK